MPKPLVIGALPQPLQGPGVLTHEGGDPIMIADVENGMPGDERTLVFEGHDERENFDDQVFTPDQPANRSTKIGEAALVRARGQANAVFGEIEAPAPKKAAKKAAKKKEAEVAA